MHVRVGLSVQEAGVADDVDVHVAGAAVVGLGGAVRPAAAAGQVIRTAHHRTRGISAALSHGAGIVSTHTVGHQVQPLLHHLGIGGQQAPVDRRGAGGVVGIPERDIALTGGLLESAHRVRIVRFDQQVDGLFELLLRQRPPPDDNFGKGGIQQVQHVLVDEQGAPHQGADHRQRDHPGQEHRVDRRKPVGQHCGELELCDGPAVADVQGGGNLGGRGVRRIARPPIALIIGIPAASPDLLGDHCQPSGIRGRRRPVPALDRLIERSVIQGVQHRGLRQRSIEHTFDSSEARRQKSVSSPRTSVTVLHQDFGDSSGGLGGDTSASKLRWWLFMSPLILASGWRSRSGPMTRPAGRSRRSAPSMASLVCRYTSCVNAPRSTDRPRCSNPRPDDRSRARRGSAMGGQGPRCDSTGRSGGLWPGSWADQRARQDARHDLQGEVLAEHTRTRHQLRRQRPTPRPTPRPGNRHRSPDTPTVTHVLIQNCHACPEPSQSDKSQPHWTT
ncbi:hypothetical protein BH09ACT8_BH09ACT8_46900 [soil metagenome]